MKDWQLVETPSSGPAIMDIDTQDTIMYIDDLNHDVMARVVEIYNTNSNEDFVSKIDAYLLDEEKCTQDEREFVIEQLTAYIKLKTMSEEQIITAEPLVMTHTPPSPPVELTKGQRAAATRKANALAAKKTIPGKKTDTVGVIKSLEEKIQLVRILDAAEVPEIPTGLGKEARDLMVAFQKDQDALVQKYMNLIQKL